MLQGRFREVLRLLDAIQQHGTCRPRPAPSLTHLYTAARAVVPRGCTGPLLPSTTGPFLDSAEAH